MKESRNKWLSYFEYYKSGAFIPGQSEQQLKIQFHFLRFNPVVGEGKWYDDAASQVLKCMG